MYFTLRPYEFLKKLILFFFEPLIKKISFDREKVEKLLREKPVVFVFYAYSFLDYVIISYHLKKSGLKEPLLFCPPFPRLLAFFRKLTGKKEPDIAGELKKAVEEKRPVVVFLRYYVDNTRIFELIFSLQKAIEESIQFIPTVLLWKKRPLTAKKRLIDVIFGPTEFPGKVRKIVLFIRNYRTAFFHFGEPVDLKNYIEENSGAPDEVKIRKLRLVLRYHLSRELHTILGPPRWPRKYVIKYIANDPVLVDELKRMATERNQDWRNLQKKVEKYLYEISADISQTFIQLLDIILTWVFYSIYEGMDYNREYIEKIREAARKGSIVIVPCHRSHLDYLIMSYIFYYENLSLPYIAAGINLSFFPLGPIFRGAGAFFIRRSFRDNRIYALSLHHYIRYLLNLGSNIEFFIEGTRSRNGKLLAPRLGMVKMIVKNYVEGLRKEVNFLPVGITYEIVVEEKSYLKELEGGEKEKESFKGLLKASKVLKNRYGMVYIRFRPMIDVGEFLRERGIEAGRSYNDSELAPVIEELGYLIINEIGKAVTITPSSLLAISILMNPTKGVDEKTLYDNAEFILSLAEKLDIPITTSLRDYRYGLRKALGRFTKGDLVEIATVAGEKVIVVKDDKRIAVDYYKNNIIHYFVFPSLSALSFMAGEGSEKEVYEKLVDIFTYEFNLKYVDEEEKSYDRWIDFLSSAGIINDRIKLTLMGELVKNFIESYIIVFQTLIEAGPGEYRESKLVQEALKIGKVLFLKGELWRPESFSKINFTSALKSLTDRGMLRMKKSGTVRRRDIIEMGEREINMLREEVEFLKRILLKTGKVGR